MKGLENKKTSEQLIIYLLIIVLSTLIIVISPIFTEKYRKQAMYKQEFVKGKIIEIIYDNTHEDPFVKNRYTGNQRFKVKILEGTQRGNIFEITHTLTSLRSTNAKLDMIGIFTVRTSIDDKVVVWFYNYKRDTILYILLLLLFTIVILIGRREGLNSLLALFFTAIVILYIVIPGMWSPYPILIAVISSIIICIFSFISICGLSKKALIAALGTFLGIILAGTISTIFSYFLNINGVDMSKGESLVYLAQDRGFKIQAILFVSILIASLGATMDIAISIASSASEIYKANPNIKKKEMFKSLMNVGKDIIGTMTNTLILAFIGSSLPLAMMIWGYSMKYDQIINMSHIVVSILQAVSGSIGMIASVAFTAIIAILIIYGRNYEK